MSEGFSHVDLNSDVAPRVDSFEPIPRPLDEQGQWRVQSPVSELVGNKIENSQKENDSTEGFCELGNGGVGTGVGRESVNGAGEAELPPVFNVADVKPDDGSAAGVICESEAKREGGFEDVNGSEEARAEDGDKKTVDNEVSVLELKDCDANFNALPGETLLDNDGVDTNVGRGSLDGLEGKNGDDNGDNVKKVDIPSAFNADDVKSCDGSVPAIICALESGREGRFEYLNGSKEARVDVRDKITVGNEVLVLELEDCGRKFNALPEDTVLGGESKREVVGTLRECTERKDVDGSGRDYLEGDGGNHIKKNEKEENAQILGIASCLDELEVDRKVKECCIEEVFDQKSFVAVSSSSLQKDTSSPENIALSGSLHPDLTDDFQCSTLNVAGSRMSICEKERSTSIVPTSDNFEKETVKAHVDGPTDKGRQATCIDFPAIGVTTDVINGADLFNIGIDLDPYIRTDKNASNDVTVKPAISILEFHISDLVWGKVRSHPWWPGQIFDPSDSSKNAKKYIKKDGYLIAYFGDHTFAWNEASKIKSFQEHFSLLEKQSNLQDFHEAVNCALDEVARRVEFGLACHCLSSELYSELKTQVIFNAGIKEESSRRDRGDSSFEAASFDPMKLVECMKSFAQFPHGETDRLELLITRAEVLAFYRWKGYYELPEFNVLGGLLENDNEILFLGEENKQKYSIKDREIKIDKGVKSRGSSSNKRKHDSGDGGHSCKRKRTLSDLVPEKLFHTPKHDNGFEKKSILKTSGKKRKGVDISEASSAVKSKKGLTDVVNKSVWSNQSFRVGESIQRAASKLSVLNSIIKHGDETSQKDLVENKSKEKQITEKPQSRKFVVSDIPSPHEVLSQLCLAARDPMKDYSCLKPMVQFLWEFRNSVDIDYSGSVDPGKVITKSGNTETSKLKLTEDSYWTDRLIQGVSEDQSSLKNQTGPALSPSLDDNSMESYPTALILKFTDLDSVPSETDLNKIFSRYGALNESQTEIMKKSSSAKIVFTRREDAETAFSSAGKYSIFGPSLVSYRLKFVSTNTRRKGSRRPVKKK